LPRDEETNGISLWYGGGLGRRARTGRGSGQTARQRRVRQATSSGAARGRDGLQYALVHSRPQENADPNAEGGERHVSWLVRVGTPGVLAGATSSLIHLALFENEFLQKFE
jgi:hypothetical protein